MIVYEQVMLNGLQYVYVHSDSMFVLQRDDGKELYDDLVLLGEHTYEETDRKIGEKPIDETEQALKILLGMEA